MKHHRLSLILLAVSLLLQLCLAGHKNKHGGNNRLIELLTAGIVAKVLQKNDGHEGGGGGGGGYYTIPIPLHMGSQRSHSHVTEKIIPIPIPHHTTRIIHINAGSHHGSGGEGGFDTHGSGGYGDHGGGGYGDHGGGGYGDHHGGGGGGYEEAGHYDGPVGAGGDHHDGRHSHRSPTIQQLMFHDSGVYGMPQPPRPPLPHPAGILMRRPIVGMMPPHPAMSMGMMSAHTLPALSAAQAHPAVSAARPPAVRVRHYYPLPSMRHRLLAYPTMPQLRYHPMPPRPW